MGFFSDAVGWLIPPANATPEQLMRWRFTMGIWAVLCFMMFVCLYTITAKGEDINDLKIAVYPATMTQLNEKRCLTDDFVVRHTLTESIQKYQLEYKKITGAEWPLDSCEAIREQARQQQ